MINIESYDDLMELVDKLEVAALYNEPQVLFKEQLIPVSEAESIVNNYTKGG